MSQEKAVVILSTKSWHYKLIKLVLGSVAPTPDNMHNLCPYFWLLVFSILTCPIVLPAKVIVWVISSLEKWTQEFTMSNMTVPAATSWAEKLTDLDVYQIHRHDKTIKKSYQKAFGEFDSYYEEKVMERKDFSILWWEKKYGKKAQEDGSNKYSRTYTKAFSEWLNEQQAAYDELCDQESEKERLKRQQKVQYEEKISKFRDDTDDFFDRVGDAISSWKTLIKWTKKVVGVIITGTGLVATYFVVSFIGKGVLWFVEHWDWSIVMWMGIAAAAIGLIVLIVYLMKAWIDYMTDKGTDLWYVKAVYVLVMIIFWPFKIIFYHLIWQLILVNLWYLLKKGARLIWGSILGFLGIFGEYFGASYGDYCPGIEWEENKEE